jgi:hypothetical protein
MRLVELGALSFLCAAAACSGDDDTKTASPRQNAPSCENERDPESVSRTCATRLESEPHVAVTTSADVAVAWIGVGTYDVDIGVTVSRDNGDTWNDIQHVAATDGRVASDPVLAVDADGAFVLTFVGFRFAADGDPEDMHLYVAKAAAGSPTFSAPVDITYPDDAVHVDKPWITRTAEGKLLITYAYDDGETGGLVAATSADGQTFSYATIVEGPISGSYRNLTVPCIAADTGRIYVAYFELGLFARGFVRARFSDDGGMSWSTTMITANDDGESAAFSQPGCVAAGDDLWMTYGTSDEPNETEEAAVSFPLLRAIRLAHSADAGATITTRSDIHDPGAGSLYLHPALLREPDGSLDVTYYAGKKEADGGGTFRYSRMAAGAPTFGAAEPVGPSLVFTGRRDKAIWLGDYTGFAWLSGTLYAAWVANADGAAHVRFARGATQ